MDSTFYIRNMGLLFSYSLSDVLKIITYFSLGYILLKRTDLIIIYIGEQPFFLHIIIVSGKFGFIHAKNKSGFKAELLK